MIKQIIDFFKNWRKSRIAEQTSPTPTTEFSQIQPYLSKLNPIQPYTSKYENCFSDDNLSITATKTMIFVKV